MIEALGSIATTLFLIATAFQTVKVMRDGHANGLSHVLIWMMLVGFSIMCLYVPLVIGWNDVLMVGYIGQLIMFLVMAKFKYFPRH